MDERISNEPASNIFIRHRYNLKNKHMYIHLYIYTLHSSKGSRLLHALVKEVAKRQSLKTAGQGQTFNALRLMFLLKKIRL